MIRITKGARDTMRRGKGRDELWGKEPLTRSTAVPTMTYCIAPETGGAQHGARWTGFDICYVDEYDRVKDCERKY
jgi:hypothetical protein